MTGPGWERAQREDHRHDVFGIDGGATGSVAENLEPGRGTGFPVSRSDETAVALLSNHRRTAVETVTIRARN